VIIQFGFDRVSRAIFLGEGLRLFFFPAQNMNLASREAQLFQRFSFGKTVILIAIFINVIDIDFAIGNENFSVRTYSRGLVIVLT